MRFFGEELLRILCEQQQPVMVCDAAGVPFKTVHPKEAVLSFAISQFVGIGNRRRIRYIQAVSPSVWGAGWRGGSRTTQRIRNEQGVIIAPRPYIEHRPLCTDSLSK